MGRITLQLKTISRLLNDYKGSLLLLVILILLYQIILTSVIGLDAPVRGDERHFVETIKYFAGLDIAKVQNYKEVTTPLVYYIYALWGKIAGFELSNLRILSLIISFIVYISLHRLFFITLEEKTYVFFSVLFFMLNPYAIGFNLFIFTDMLTLLFIISFCISIIKNYRPAILVSGIFVLLCRQYSIFIIAAGISYYLIEYIHKQQKSLLLNIAVLIVSVLPMAVLFIIWNGFAPPEGLAYWASEYEASYNIHYLNTYISLIPVYLLPFYILKWKNFIGNYKYLAIYFCIGLFYFLFPVIPSNVTLEQTDLTTVGFVHRFIRIVFPNYTAEHLVFYFFFVFGLIFLWTVLKDIVLQIKRRVTGQSLFLNLAIVSFLLIIPFSYQVWEKYLLVLIPVLMLRFLMPFSYKKAHAN